MLPFCSPLPEFHCYLQRTAGFGPGSLTFILLGVVDLQRMETGIAMCHLELAAREPGLTGKWEVHEPGFHKPGAALEYAATWIGA